MPKNTPVKKISSKKVVKEKIELDSLINTKKEYNELYSIALLFVRQENIKSKYKKSDKELDKIAKSSLKLLNTPLITIQKLKESPFLLYDIKYKIIIRILNIISSSHKSEYLQWSDKFFKEAGLSLFIPNRPKNTSQYIWILYWREEPEDFINLVGKYKNIIKKHRDSKLELTNEKQISKLQKAYLDIYGAQFPELTIKYSMQDYALAFISKFYNTPYSSVRKLFYSKDESIQKFIKRNKEYELLSLENGEFALLKKNSY